MLYELAITPDVFDGATVRGDPQQGSELTELLRECAVRVLNVLLADLADGRWRQEVLQRLTQDQCEEGWSRTLRDRIIAHLNLLIDQHRLVTHASRRDSDPLNERDWFELATEAHLDCPLDWVVVTPKLAGQLDTKDPKVGHLPEFRVAPSWEQISSSLTVTLQRSSIEAALIPLLRHARRLKIVDPFLTHEKLERPQNIMRIAASVMGMRGLNPRSGEIEVHVRDPASGRDGRGESVDDCLNCWQQALGTLSQQLMLKHRFSIFVWRDRPGKDMLHNRYLLTDQCGVFAGRSYDQYKPKSGVRDQWVLLARPEVERLWWQYDYTEGETDPSRTEFHLVGHQRNA